MRLATNITFAFFFVTRLPSSSSTSASSIVPERSALLVVDVQECFLDSGGTSSGEPGSLAVGDSSAIIPIINEMRQEKSCLFDIVVRSQDFHQDHHISFGSTHGLDPFAHLTAGKGELPLMCIKPSTGLVEDASCCPAYHIDPDTYDCDTHLCPSVEASTADAVASVLSSEACSVCKDTPEECFATSQAMWTDHCLQSGDSSFPGGLYSEESDMIVQKGTNLHADAYSAFMDNTKTLKTPLDEKLSKNSITSIYIVGIATDYCVYYSALDAIDLGYQVYVVLDATRGISEETTQSAVSDMESKGVHVIQSADIMNMECAPAANSTFVASEPKAASSAFSLNAGARTLAFVYAGFALIWALASTPF